MVSLVTFQDISFVFVEEQLLMKERFIPFTAIGTIRPKDIFEASIMINSIRNQWLCIPVDNTSQ